MVAHVHRPLVTNSVSVVMDSLVSGNQKMLLMTVFTYHRGTGTLHFNFVVRK